MAHAGFTSGTFYSFIVHLILAHAFFYQMKALKALDHGSASYVLQSTLSVLFILKAIYFCKKELECDILGSQN